MKKLLILLSLLVALSGSFVHADTEIIDGVVEQGGTEIVDGVPQESDYPIYGDVEVINGVRTTGDVETVNGVPQNFMYDFRFDADSSNPLVALGKQGAVGTWTYTGANTRSFFNKDAIMEFEADDTKPIYHYVNGVKFFRMEPERINLCLDSRNIDNSSTHWVESGTGTAVQNAIGVDGVANKATTITDSDAGAHYYIIKDNVANKSSSDTNPFCFSVPIKKTVGATTFPAYGIYWSGGTTKTSYCVLNTNTGVITADVTNTAANISGRCVDTGGDWWRVWVTATDNGGNTKVRYILLPAVNADASGTLVTSTQGSAVFDAAQLEYNAKAPTSYVDNDGVTLGSNTVVDGATANKTEDNKYTSDFSAGVDGWTASQGAVAGNIDAIGGQDNNLRFTCNAVAATHGITDPTTYTVASRFRVRFDYYIPAAQSNIDSLRVHWDTGNWITDELTTTGSWTSVDAYSHAENATLVIKARDGGTGNFQDAGGDDLFYIRNYRVEKVTLNDWNEGDYVGHTGSADTVTVTGDQGDTVNLEQGYLDWSKPCWLAEVDPAGRMVVTDGNTITITALDKDEDCYKYRDMGTANYFVTTSDFTHYVDFNCSAFISTGTFCPYALSSSNDDLFDIFGLSGDALFIMTQGSGTDLKLELYEFYGGSYAIGTSVTLTAATDYYCTIDHDASEGTYGTTYCHVYSDAARKTSVGTSTLALNADHTHDHIGAGGYNSGVGGKAWSGTVKNLSIAKKPTPGKVYKIASTATRTAGSYTIEYGSADGSSHNAAGTYYDHITATDNDFLKIKFDSAFSGTVDDITIEEMGEARLSEEAALSFPIPTGVFDNEGTVLIGWMPGYNEEDVINDSSILTLRNTTRYSLLYHSFGDNGLRSYDGTTPADKALAFDAYDLYKLAVVFPSSANKYKLGADSGTGMSFGAEVAWDGSYIITGTDIIFGYDLTGTTYFSVVDIYPEVLSTQEIDAIRGSPNN